MIVSIKILLLGIIHTLYQQLAYAGMKFGGANANNRNSDLLLKFHRSKDQNLLFFPGKDSKRYLDPLFQRV